MGKRLVQGSVRTQHALKLPTLLQTDGMLGITVAKLAEVREGVKSNQLLGFYKERQVILGWPADFEFLLNWSVLEELDEGPVGTAQLERLVELAGWTNITIRLRSGE